ncbi:hypothetical protein ID866_10474, partial [Astraeus odoratus]
GHTSGVFSVAFSPNDSLIVSGSLDKTIRVWDAHTGSQIGSPIEGHTNVVWSVAFSPDGRWIVSGSGSEDKTIRIWDAHTGSQIGSPFEGHTGQVLSVAFSSDGRWIVSGSVDRTIRVWDAHTGSQIGSPFEGHTSVYDGVDNQRGLVGLNADGWIIGPEGRLLLWVPSYYHAFLYSPRNALVIPRGGPELDLSAMVHGDKWQDCYVGK